MGQTLFNTLANTLFDHNGPALFDALAQCVDNTSQLTRSGFAKDGFFQGQSTNTHTDGGNNTCGQTRTRCNLQGGLCSLLLGHALGTGHLIRLVERTLGRTTNALGDV